MQMKKLVSVILAVCMLVSMFTILPLSAGAETATKTITVGVVDYLNLSGDYQVHYWGGAESGDAAATAINTQKQKSVGQDYWQGGEMTYNMFEATIPADATGFKFHIGETWFGDDGNTADSNAVYAFEYGGNYLAYYDNETPAAPETQAPTTAPETQAPTTAPETTAPVVGEEVTLYFSNNKGWSDIKAHMWKEGGESTEWPGAAAAYVGDNDYGEGIYSVTINTATYDHVIFNGNGGQTANIAVADAVAGGCGVYCLDTQDGEGHYNVDFYEYSAEPETTAPETTAPETTATEETTAPETGKSIHAYFTGVEAPGSAWMAWTWNDGEEGEWRPIEKFAYVSVKDNVLFANFNEVNLNASWDDVLAQTVDTKVKDGDSISVLNEKDNEGKYLIKWASDETTAPETTAPETTAPTTAPETTAPVVGEEVTLYFSNNKGWSDIKAHMWKEGGESTEWPGVAATYVGENDYGEGIYSVTINTATYDHVIFNGNGGQTANIAVADAVAGGLGVYCLDTQDGEGHYNVGFYEYSAEPETQAPSTAPETTAPETTAPVALTDGYYVVGDISGWAAAAEYKMTKNDAAEIDEYMIYGVAFTAEQGFKVVSVKDGNIEAWYPEGMDNNCVINDAGTYDIYFRPNYDGGEDWFNGCIYVTASTEPSTEPATEPSTEPSTEPVEHTITIVDGKYYVDGEIVKNAGLIEYEDNYYYVRSDGSVFTGGKLNVTEAKANGLLPAGTYVFDDEGKMVNSGTIVNGYYYEKGKIARGAGVVQINSGYYFVQKDGSVAVNAKRLGISEAKTNGLIEPGYYNSNENGKLDITGIFGSKGYYFRDGVVILGAGVVQYKGGLYFVMNDGTIAKSRKLGVSAAKSNGLVAPGYYEFDETGKMLTDGIVNGYYYENGVVQLGKGIIEIDGDFYFVRTDGSIYKNGKINVPEAKTNGLIEAGSYSFDADGKLIAE